MKRKITIASLFSLLSLAACHDDENFENKVYLDCDIRNEVRVAVDEHVEEMDFSFKVCVARPVSENLKVNFAVAPEMLATYKVAFNDEDAILLPEGHYELSQLEAEIRQGRVESGDIIVPFKNLGEGQGLDYTKKYVLPVNIETDGVEMLSRARTIYLVVMKASLVNVTADIYANRAWPVWDNFTEVQDMEHFTMEALINPRAFTNESSINTIMGIEDDFLIRVGDAGLATNQIQIAFACKDADNKTYRNSLTDPTMQLKTDNWYHIALTFDGGEDKTDGADIKFYINGKLKIEGKSTAVDGDGNVMAKNKVNFMVEHSEEDNNKPRCFWIGYSYNNDRSFNGFISEVRMWKKVLTEEEINAPAHFYKLYPDEETGNFPEELVAYWKFDNGKGKIVKDYSIYGNDLTGNQNFIWYPVNLPIE
ncbi:MAG: DUF1735 domain-containing protein [Bacteroidales bacterium]|nr:DUF1735 domain-containing protein [Bacteroidales bacterium]